MPPRDAQARRLGLEELFEIRSVLGEGGMGSVYEAVQQGLGRVVALKVLRHETSTDPVYRERFLREAQLATQIKHPHVVGVLDYGQTPQCLYIAFQKIDGPSLAERLKRAGPLDQDSVVPLFAALLEGLTALHHHGIIHRDLKPANILIEGSHPYITDLGIAQRKGGARLTAADTTVGTPAYMSPEQIQGLPLGPPADLYALGCVLFECLCGSPPYTGKPPAVLQSHVRAVIPRVEPRRSDLHPGWSRVLQRVLAKDPADRFQTADELKVELIGLAHSLSDRSVPTRIVETPREGFDVVSKQQATLVGLPPLDTGDRRRRRRGLALLSMAAMVVLGLAGALALRRPPAPPAGAAPPTPAPPTAALPPAGPDPAISELIKKHLDRFTQETSVTTFPVAIYGKEGDPGASSAHRAVWARVHERFVGFPLADDESGIAFLLLDPEALESASIWTSSPAKVTPMGPGFLPVLVVEPATRNETLIPVRQLSRGLNVVTVARDEAGDPLRGELRVRWRTRPAARLPDRPPPPERFRPQLVRIERHIREQLWLSVERDAQKLLEAAPDLLEAHYLLALARTSLARTQWQNDRAALLSFMSEGLLMQGDPGASLEQNVAGALEQIRIILERRQEPRTWSLLGLLLTEIGMIDAGISALEHACRLAPDEPTTWECLSDSYEPIGHQLLEEWRKAGQVKSTAPYLAVRPGVSLELVRNLIEYERIAMDLRRTRDDVTGAHHRRVRRQLLEDHVRKITSGSVQETPR